MSIPTTRLQSLLCLCFRSNLLCVFCCCLSTSNLPPTTRLKSLGCCSFRLVLPYVFLSPKCCRFRSVLFCFLNCFKRAQSRNMEIHPNRPNQRESFAVTMILVNSLGAGMFGWGGVGARVSTFRAAISSVPTKRAAQRAHATNKSRWTRNGWQIFFRGGVHVMLYIYIHTC